MSTSTTDGGLVEVFVKGAVFTLGAAAVGLVLRRFVRREPEIVVVEAVPDDVEDGTPAPCACGGRG